MLRKKKRSHPIRQYPALALLMGEGGYFYQDWPADFGTVENVIKAFCEIESPAQKRQTIKEIDVFLEDYAEEAPRTLEKAIASMGNSYHYHRARYTAVSWLKHLQSEIQKSLEK